MSKAKMLAAKELIQEKQYSQARAILKTVDHPTARQWLAKLDEIAPEVDDDDFLDADFGAIKQAKKKRRIHPLIGIPLAIIGGFVLVIIIISLIDQTNAQNRYHAQLSEAKASLSIFCSIGTTIPDYRCEQWVNETFDADISHTDDVLFCDEIYNSLIDGESYAACLARSGIYLP